MFLEVLKKIMKISRKIIIIGVIAAVGLGAGTYYKYAKAETLEDVLNSIEIDDVKTREQVEQEKEIEEKQKEENHKVMEREKIKELIKNKDKKNIIFLDLKDGRVVIELLPKVAPDHAYRMKKLAREGFYDGLKFHRVIEGFMAQTGDPTGTGSGGSYLGNLKAEFNNESHVRGTVSMARAFDPNSANSQFFIVFKDSRFLDGKYTVFGRVIYGMEHVDNIKKGNPDQNGMVKKPDVIIGMAVASDLDKEIKSTK